MIIQKKKLQLQIHFSSSFRFNAFKVNYSSFITVAFSLFSIACLILFTALQWLKETSIRQNVHTLQYMPGVLFVILPCLSYSEEFSKKNIKELAKFVNSKLWEIIDKSDSSSEEIKSDLSLIKVVESLMKHLSLPNESLNIQTGIEGLEWLSHMINNQPEARI